MDAWLIHPELVDAFVALSKCIEQMRLSQEWTNELEQIWLKLRDVQAARPAMAEALQLNEQRRKTSVKHVTIAQY